MAACDGDMRFTFAWAGWEGRAHNARIFHLASRDEKLKFPHPPPGLIIVLNMHVVITFFLFYLSYYFFHSMLGKYYLVDVGLVQIICVYYKMNNEIKFKP